MILAIAERTLAPWCDRMNLNLAQAIEIHPQALAQFPHRDCLDRPEQSAKL
jgi:hypothetical protein